jgi:hypothetical protein
VFGLVLFPAPAENRFPKPHPLLLKRFLLPNESEQREQINRTDTLLSCKKNPYAALKLKSKKTKVSALDATFRAALTEKI